MKKKRQIMNYKSYLCWAFFLLIIYELNNTVNRNRTREISYSKFIEEVKSDNIKEVYIRGENIIKGSIKRKNGQDISFRTVGTIGDATFKIFEKHGIVTNHLKKKKLFIIISMLINFIPWLALYAIFYILLTKIEESENKASEILDIIKKIDEY